MLFFSFVYFLKFGGFFYFFISFIYFLLVLGSWFYSLNYECQVGYFTYLSYFLFRFGFLLFICSEVLFFFGFFWCFFSNCWVFNLYFFSWPPFGFDSLIVDVFGYPLLKTVLLLSSGFRLTVVHYYILIGDYLEVLYRISVNDRLKYRYPVFVENTEFSFVNYGYCLTIFFGLLFLYFQFYEYVIRCICINSTVYGSIFFILTGFHGLHVLVGLIMLIVSFIRNFYLCYSSVDHVGFECAAWYWHFVDVVWLFLYVFVYWYGS